jgi:hypothetical protein
LPFPDGLQVGSFPEEVPVLFVVPFPDGLQVGSFPEEVPVLFVVPFPDGLKIGWQVFFEAIFWS